MKRAAFDVFEQEVTEPDEFIVSSDYNNISCYGENDGSIDIEVEGGGGDYDYTWTLDGVLFSTDQDLSNLSPGSYSVTVIDNSGCGEAILPFSIIEPEEIQIVTYDVECYGYDNGFAEITVSGGQSYDLLLDGVSVNSGGISTPIIINNLSPGNYTITITDSECEDVTDSFFITEPEEIIISLDDYDGRPALFW